VLRILAGRILSGFSLVQNRDPWRAVVNAVIQLMVLAPRSLFVGTYSYITALKD
jgi:hypothetical protein